MKVSVGDKTNSTFIPNYNTLNDVPESLHSEIYYVCLSDQQLDELPDLIYELENLEILDISNNAISKFPVKLLKLKKLRKLFIQKNPVTFIPPRAIKKLLDYDMFRIDIDKIVYKNMMLVTKYNNNMEISSDIDTMVIFIPNAGTKFNNLPQNLTYLRICSINVGPIVLDNIPCCLKTLILNNVFTMSNDIKLPFDCVLYTSIIGSSIRI
jgi:Leucine-rich repeat (LRR) protein